MAISKIAGRGSIPRTLANKRIIMKDLLKKLSKALTRIGLIFAVAFLGSLGGQGIKEVRRFIIPLLVTIYAYFLLQNWWVLSIYLMVIPLSLGYGIPSFNGPQGSMDDEGSMIGAFFYKIFKSEVWANISSRAVIGLLISASMLSVPILKGTWISFLVGSALIIGVWGAVSWRGFGQFPVKIFGKTYNLLWVDVTVYAVTACAFVVMVQGFFK
jgi:hypothetical protein